MYQSYWLNFGQNQHSADFGDLPQDLSDDFWCVNAPSHVSSSDSSGDNDPNTDDERNVHVLNHPHCIDHAQLRKGVIVAVQPNDNHYNDNPDEIEEQFW